MPRAKTSVTIDEALLQKVDELVANDTFESRSAAVESALRVMLAAEAESRFETELDKLDPAEERAWAEWGMEGYQELVERPS